ncbi:MAG TPA: prepilin-type N-terminal cleavage/methylation domain-containing protein [Anaeromyxobacter sp.]|nr:prepilin-type N-terminal cleavage/methylation domain-containing protein [Anaeromyxobacter sp.]
MRTVRERLPTRRGDRGVSMLEVVIALALLSVGLIGMMRLQIFGITANGGARATTAAAQLASELAAALERLEFDDLRLTGAGGNSPPTPFGRLIGTDLTRSHVHAWSDGAAMLGVRLDSALPPDPADVSKPQYRRRWSVWDYETNTPTGQAASKVIAVSVIYRERGNPVERELVVLTHKPNAGLAVSYVAGYR